MGLENPIHLLIIALVIVLLFGAKRLPDMARSIGQSARVFKGEMKGLRDDEKAPEQAPRTDAPQDSRAPRSPETPGSTAP